VSDKPTTHFSDLLLNFFAEDGGAPFVFRVEGNITVDLLAEIEKQAQEDAENLFCKGSGNYLFKVTRFDGERDDQGRMYLQPCWDFEFKEYLKP
jgi:hypothetical protein